VSEQEFIAKATRDLARVQTMTPEERDRMMQEYSRFRSRHGEDLDAVCNGVGVVEYDWNYSDFVQSAESDDETRPPTSMRVTHLE
jgi:hypothetical protein